MSRWWDRCLPSDLPIKSVKPPEGYAFYTSLTRSVPMKPCAGCRHTRYTIFIYPTVDIIVCEGCEDATIRRTNKTPENFKL